MPRRRCFTACGGRLRRKRRCSAIAGWREICPDLTIRSSFIVGFPGESEEDFQLLLDWLDEAELDRVGCFRYEAVAGARANELAQAVPEAVKEERWHRLIGAPTGDLARRLKAHRSAPVNR